MFWEKPVYESEEPLGLRVVFILRLVVFIAFAAHMALLELAYPPTTPLALSLLRKKRID